VRSLRTRPVDVVLGPRPPGLGLGRVLVREAEGRRSPVPGPRAVVAELAERVQGFLLAGRAALAVSDLQQELGVAGQAL
jgi:hypothetical protein